VNIIPKQSRYSIEEIAMEDIKLAKDFIVAGVDFKLSKRYHIIHIKMEKSSVIEDKDFSKKLKKGIEKQKILIKHIQLHNQAIKFKDL
jgi:hypothetical protein